MVLALRFEFGAMVIPKLLLISHLTVTGVLVSYMPSVHMLHEALISTPVSAVRTT